jgi:catechol 2,3-dioxygenase-like lactoylglutathione lyase family enzyme
MTALTLDHLVIAVRDLDLAAESYTRILGLEPSWRGRHPAYGTANVLYRLDNTYVELLAPAAAGDSPWRAALLEQLVARGEGLYAIALGTSDIDATAGAARGRGLDVLEPQDGDGIDAATGARRAWRNARIRPDSTRGVVAFFIEHCSPGDALPRARAVAPGACATGVDHTVIASSDLAAALALWRDGFGLDLRLSVDRPGGVQLHFLRLGDTILELAGRAATRDPRPSSPGGVGQGDQLWGVSYRVDDVAATVERLRAAGVTVSDVRTGNAPGTLVADLKPGFSHDVRTLFIQKEARA